MKLTTIILTLMLGILSLVATAEENTSSEDINENVMMIQKQLESSFV